MATLVLSFRQTPIYEGKARLLLQPASDVSLFDSNATTARIDPELLVETEIQVIKSDPVRTAVEQKLGPVRDVEAERVGESLMIEVRGHSTDPERAAAVSNAYANTYVEFRRRQATDEMLGAGEGIQAKINELQRQIDALDSRATSRRDVLVAQQARFKDRLDEIEVEAGLQSGAARVVSTASVPKKPVKPAPVRNALLASIAGVFLGVSLAGLLEYLDDTVMTKDDLARVTGGLPVLGVVPIVRAWRTRRSGLQLTAAGDPMSPASEAYRALRTSVQLLGVDRPVRSVQVTSAVAGEGKTTTAANLASSLSASGQRVVLVDCDLRRPRLAEAFGVGNEVGITSVLAGHVSLSDAIQLLTTHHHLHLLTAGPLPPDPSELLGSRRASELVFAIQSEFDIVVIDSAPVLPVTDATLLAAWVDATMLVVTSGATRSKHLRGAIELLRRVDAPLMGTVLNQATAEAGFGYRYGRYEANGERRLLLKGGRRSRRRGTRIAPSTPVLTQATGSPPGSGQSGG